MPDLRKLKARGPRRLPPRVRQPDGARIEYFRALSVILARAHALVRERLFPLLPELLDRLSEKRGNFRTDLTDLLADIRRAPPQPLPSRTGAAGHFSAPLPEGRADAASHPGRRINTVMDRISASFWRSLPQERLEKLAQQIAEETSARQRTELFRQVKALMGIDLQTIADRKLGTEIKQFTAENVALIKSIPDQYFGDVEKTVLRGMTQGERHEEIATQLEERLGVAEDRAKLIARDQVGKFFGALNETRQQELGIDRYIWRTVNDNRVRPEHEERDGEVFSWSDPPEDGPPGQAVNCRCYAEPILPGDEPPEE